MNAACDSLDDVSNEALYHRVKWQLARVASPNSVAWAALDELLRRAREAQRGA